MCSFSVCSMCLCVLTQRSSQSETGQRVEGAHDGANCSDPHWDGVVVGVLWACWESPRLHQQQMLYPAYTHMQLPDQMYKRKCRNSIKTPHIYFFFYIWACSLFGKWCKKKKEMAKLENHLELCPLTHTLTQTQSTCVGISACRLQTGILRGCVPAAPSPEAPPSPSTPPGLPQTDPRPPWGRC